VSGKGRRVLLSARMVGTIRSMAESVARTTLNKARYFLSQAEIHQSDSGTSASRLPFVANLEAAIICGRSVLDHLRKELAPKNPTYRAWHDAKRKVLESNAVFRQFSHRRNFILHEGPEKTSVTFFAAVKFKGTSSMSVEATIIRADAWLSQRASSLREVRSRHQNPSSHIVQRRLLISSISAIPTGC
jgi:hypothetical protein